MEKLDLAGAILLQTFHITEAIETVIMLQDKGDLLWEAKTLQEVLLQQSAS